MPYQRDAKEAIDTFLSCLDARLREQLAEVEGVEIADQGETRCGIVTFTLTDARAGAIKSALAQHRINVTVSDGSGTRVSYDRRGITETVRASVHYFNTGDEIEQFVRVVGQ